MHEILGNMLRMRQKYLIRGKMEYTFKENLSMYNLLTSISCQQNRNYRSLAM